jgi:putative methionine-R-sulfoxide reductase with GAF domain
MELNSICHMHCIAGDVVTFVLLLNWVGIYLYLVTANKILTNFKKQCSALTILFGKPYTSRELPPLASSCTLFPTTC